MAVRYGLNKPADKGNLSPDYNIDVLEDQNTTVPSYAGGGYIPDSTYNLLHGLKWAGVGLGGLTAADGIRRLAKKNQQPRAAAGEIPGGLIGGGLSYLLGARLIPENYTIGRAKNLAWLKEAMERHYGGEYGDSGGIYKRFFQAMKERHPDWDPNDPIMPFDRTRGIAIAPPIHRQYQSSRYPVYEYQTKIDPENPGGPLRPGSTLHYIWGKPFTSIPNPQLTGQSTETERWAPIKFRFAKHDVTEDPDWNNLLPESKKWRSLFGSASVAPVPRSEILGKGLEDLYGRTLTSYPLGDYGAFAEGGSVPRYGWGGAALGIGGGLGTLGTGMWLMGKEKPKFVPGLGLSGLGLTSLIYGLYPNDSNAGNWKQMYTLDDIGHPEFQEYSDAGDLEEDIAKHDSKMEGMHIKGQTVNEQQKGGIELAMSLNRDNEREQYGKYRTIVRGIVMKGDAARARRVADMYARQQNISPSVFDDLFEPSTDSSFDPNSVYNLSSDDPLAPISSNAYGGRVARYEDGGEFVPDDRTRPPAVVSTKNEESIAPGIASTLAAGLINAGKKKKYGGMLGYGLGASLGLIPGLGAFAPTFGKLGAFAGDTIEDFLAQRKEEEERRLRETFMPNEGEILARQLEMARAQKALLGNTYNTHPRQQMFGMYEQGGEVPRYGYGGYGDLYRNLALGGLGTAAGLGSLGTGIGLLLNRDDKDKKNQLKRDIAGGVLGLGGIIGTPYALPYAYDSLREIREKRAEADRLNAEVDRHNAMVRLHKYTPTQKEIDRNLEELNEQQRGFIKGLNQNVKLDKNSYEREDITDDNLVSYPDWLIKEIRGAESGGRVPRYDWGGWAATGGGIGTVAGLATLASRLNSRDQQRRKVPMDYNDNPANYNLFGPETSLETPIWMLGASVPTLAAGLIRMRMRGGIQGGWDRAAEGGDENPRRSLYDVLSTTAVPGDEIAFMTQDHEPIPLAKGGRAPRSIERLSPYHGVWSRPYDRDTPYKAMAETLKYGGYVPRYLLGGSREDEEQSPYTNNGKGEYYQPEAAAGGGINQGTWEHNEDTGYNYKMPQNPGFGDYMTKFTNSKFMNSTPGKLLYKAVPFGIGLAHPFTGAALGVGKGIINQDPITLAMSAVPMMSHAMLMRRTGNLGLGLRDLQDNFKTNYNTWHIPGILKKRTGNFAYDAFNLYRAVALASPLLRG